MLNGGSNLLAAICQVPGASKTLLAGYVPYSSKALHEFINGTPEQTCCTQTARYMAMAAFNRARQLSLDTEHLFGLGCTASLKTSTAKRGAYRIHTAVQTSTKTNVTSLILQKNQRLRADQEQLAANLCLNLLVESIGIKPLELDLLNNEQLQTHKFQAPLPWQELITDRVAIVDHAAHAAHTSGGVQSEIQSSRIILPGSFNPFHQGHLKIAQYATAKYSQAVDFEICVRNVDKPPLDYQEIRNRTRTFPAGYKIWLTTASTFADKAKLFPNSTFLVGIDTMARIVNPIYYSGNRLQMIQMLKSIQELECAFLIFGRRTKNGSFMTLKDIKIPAEISQLCTAVKEDDFRLDLESSQLRQQQL